MGPLVVLLAQSSCPSLELCNLYGTMNSLYTLQSQDVQIWASMRSVCAMPYTIYCHELCLFTSCAINIKKRLTSFTICVLTHGAHTEPLADLRTLTEEQCRA